MQQKSQSTNLEADQSQNFRVLNGPLQEIVMYASDKSTNRTDIETDINDFFSIY